MISFRHPYLLLALAAAVLPVLIYLLTRDRVTVVPFSTLRFFAGNAVTLVRRKRWLEILLLALRAALVVLIVLAFARPLLRDKAGTGADGQERLADARVILVDVSRSMARPGAWERAMEKAAAAMDGGAIALVAFDQSPQVIGAWSDAESARARLRTLQPGAGGTDLVAALRKADELLADVAAESRRIVLVSDLQRIGLSETAAAFKLSPGVSLQVEAIEPESPQRVAIVEADLPQTLVADQSRHRITLRLASFASEPVEDVAVELALPGQEPQTQTLTIPPGQRLTASFQVALDRTGDHAGTITLKAGGQTETIYLNPHVLPRINVVILAAPEDAKRVGSSAFFLERAIRPGNGSPFDVRIVPASGPVDLADSSVLIVADVASIPPALKQQIIDFHNAGGGVLLLPGPRTQPGAFNAAFGAIAPAQLRRVLAAADTRRGPALLTRVDLRHPILEVFSRPHSGNFASVEISHYWEVTDSQLSRVPMRLDDGRPYLLERQGAAGGSVVMLTSPPDPAWSNLHQRAIYLPLLHQVLRHLAVRSEAPTTYQAGDILRIPANHTLRDPTGQAHSGASLVATTPGHYALLDPAGNTVLTYAVNTPLVEGDAASIPPQELVAAFENTLGGEESIGGRRIAISAGGRELWPVLVGLAIALVMVELFVSNRVPRH